MSEIRTAEEMREAAAQIADAYGWPGQMQAAAYMRLTEREEASRDTAAAISAAIRALPVAAAPDDEELVKVITEAIIKESGEAGADWSETARAVLAALREAGALR